MRIDELLEEPVDWRYKGRPAAREPLTLSTLAERRSNVLAGDLLLPAMVLKESALDHNIARIADYCREHGVSLAPHGKTTMAPQLFERQLDAGAWGMTAATVAHVGVYRHFGVQRILLMNELVEPAALTWIADELASDPDFDFYCLVDSVAGVEAMTEALRGAGLERPLQVLVEVGIPGGRAGCRTLDEAKEVAAAAVASPALALAGVEGFEGIIAERDAGTTLAAVDGFLMRIRALTIELAGTGDFAGREEIVVTAGGSAFFDRVVACLTPAWDLELPVRVVLRGGCYLTHDSGLYERIGPLGARAGGDPLRPALEIWGAVLSRPEPELAIVGLGKRDVPFDIELPIPALASRGGELRDVRETLTVTALNDQHAYVRLAPGAELAVGDLVGCGISHPCLAFDKWPLIPLVDDDYTVVGGIRTFF
ncbi:MAG TPA: amino acid deaminase [Gaiellaceae bacterium]|jgi:D-serine deaminase-like pyridoxal phosphate-dependent protein